MGNRKKAPTVYVIAGQENPNHEWIGAVADAAFREAAVDVVHRAKQTGTPVITWKDGKVHEISGDELDRLLEEVLAKQPRETRP